MRSGIEVRVFFGQGKGTMSMPLKEYMEFIKTQNDMFSNFLKDNEYKTVKVNKIKEDVEEIEKHEEKEDMDAIVRTSKVKKDFSNMMI